MPGDIRWMYFEDYNIEVVRLNKLTEDDLFYWHLFFRGEKVNGGLADSEDYARKEARRYRVQHNRGLWLESYFWDEEEKRWITKKFLYL